jgi:hypothetical protein
MLRLNVPLTNPDGDGKLLIIFDPGTLTESQSYDYCIYNYNTGVE